VSITLAVAGFISSFVAAANYTLIFSFIVACDAVAMACLFWLVRTSGFSFVQFVPAALISFSLVDTILREFFEVRALDLFF
jgi:hypothetical protein